MKVTVVKVERKNTGSAKAKEAWLKTIRYSDKNNITSKEIESSTNFARARAIKTIINKIMNLDEDSFDSLNDIPQPIFDQYVHMGEIITRTFERLTQEWLEDHVAEDECDECTDCDGCDCDCCEDCDCNEEESPCEDCDAGAYMRDMLSILDIFSGVFDKDGVNDTDTINITLSGTEYNSVKKIFDTYDLSDDCCTDETE